MSQAWRQNSLDAQLWESMFFTTYSTVRTAIVTPILVVFIFLVLRLAGVRTMTQATLFNRLVLVAVGTLLGGVALRPTTPLTATVVATLIIVGFAMVVDAAYTRGWIPGWVVHATPILLYANGQMLRKNLRKSLLDPEKLHSELRMKGHASLSNVFAVILEPTGSFTVITKETAHKSDLELLQNVDGYKEHLQNRTVGAGAPAGCAQQATV